jgi:hypothetical protein
MPNQNMTRGRLSQIAQSLASTSKETARALPTSKGGETPLQLQTYRTEIYTYFTIANGQTELLYSAENWVRAKLTLETAGPVAIGTSQNLEPVLSGRGRLLDTDLEYEAFLPRGTRLFIISETVNRVSVTIEPVPWLEQIDVDGKASAANVIAAIERVGATITTALAQIKSGGAAEQVSGRQAAPTMVCPPALPRAVVPRLTPLATTKKTR